MERKKKKSVDACLTYQKLLYTYCSVLFLCFIFSRCFSFFSGGFFCEVFFFLFFFVRFDLRSAATIECFGNSFFQLMLNMGMKWWLNQEFYRMNVFILYHLLEFVWDYIEIQSACHECITLDVYKSLRLLFLWFFFSSVLLPNED